MEKLNKGEIVGAFCAAAVIGGFVFGMYTQVKDTHEACEKIKNASLEQQFESVNSEVARIVCTDEVTGERYISKPPNYKAFLAKYREGCTVELNSFYL